MTLKIGTLLFLPMPLVLWPFAGILGSFVGGIGFGFFSPLIATFEAVGENVPDKCYHCVAVRYIPFQAYLYMVAIMLQHVMFNSLRLTLYIFLPEYFSLIFYRFNKWISSNIFVVIVWGIYNNKIVDNFIEANFFIYYQ